MVRPSSSQVQQPRCKTSFDDREPDAENDAPVEESSPKRMAVATEAQSLPDSSVSVDPIRMYRIGPMLAVFESGVAYPPLGKGTYGCVMRGFRRQREPVAVKLVRLKHGLEDFKLPHTIREIVLQSRATSMCATGECRHTMPVRSLDVFIDIDKTCCVATSMPLAGKTLASVISDIHAKKIWLSRQSHRVLMRDVVHGALEVQTLFGGPGHGGHYDIKPSNTMVLRPTSAVPRVHLRTVDYGMARIIDDSDPVGIGILSSLWYRSPESLVLGNDIACMASPKHDVWSVGMVMLEMALALGGLLSVLHGARNENAMIDALVSLLGSPSSDEWRFIAEAASVDPGSPSAQRLERFMAPSVSQIEPQEVMPETSVLHNDFEFWDIVTQCLRYDPKDRPTLEQILAHPFFDGVEAVAVDPLVVQELSTVLCHDYATTSFPTSWDDTVAKCRKIYALSSYSECDEIASAVIVPKLLPLSVDGVPLAPIDARQRAAIASHLLSKAVCDVDMSLVTVIGCEVISRELFGTMRSLNIPHGVFGIVCLVIASSLVDDSIQLRNAFGYQPTTLAPRDAVLVDVIKALLHGAFVVGYRGLVARIVECVRDVRRTVVGDERSRGREAYAFVACMNRLHVGEPYESFARIWDIREDERDKCMCSENVIETLRLQNGFYDKLHLHGWARDPHCCVDLLRASRVSPS